MKAVKQSNSKSSRFAPLEALEDRQLMTAAPWNGWTTTLGIDQVYALYPWLNGSGHGVAVIDKGINYLHPLLGANPATNTPSPRIVNAYDFEDNDTDAFPEKDGNKDQDQMAGHGTGVAGLFVSPYYVNDGYAQQGMLQGALLYSLRQKSGSDNQESIKLAMEWVLANHAKYHITAVNLTDFFGTAATTPVYDAAAKQLWDAGIFVATPVANNFLGAPSVGLPPRTPIGFPGKSPWIFATGGVGFGGMRKETQRGADLDMLAPGENVTTLYYNTSNPNVVTNYATGNSWGTPMTVSTAVMIQQIDPTITPAEIMSILKDSGTPIKDPDPVTNPDGTIYYARLNVLGAVKLAYQRRDDAADQGLGNDALANATGIGLTGEKGSVSGQKLLIHDHDYYKFDVTKAGQYDVRIGYSGPSAFPGGELLDADGNLIANIGANGIADRELAAGQYFVHLYSENAALKGAYTITIDGASVAQPAVPGAHGSFNGIQFDANDKLNFAWFDEQTDTLKFATRSADNAWSNVTTIDATTGAGQFVSLKLDNDGLPGVAYYASVTADLKYAHFNGSSWDVETVSSKNVTGSYPSLGYTSANKPVISYYHGTGGDLRLATLGTGGWNVTAIDTAGDVGRYSSLALNPATGRWSVAYEATGIGGFKFANQNANGTWTTTLVDQPGLGGGYISLAFDNNKNPAFSYFNAKSSDLRLARFGGGKWSVKTVASAGGVGMYTNLLFDGASPVIYYYNKTADKLTVARGNASNVFSLTAIQSAGGRHNHVAIDADGDELAVYLDSASGDLRFL
jgi:hypothetical protein